MPFRFHYEKRANSWNEKIQEVIISHRFKEEIKREHLKNTLKYSYLNPLEFGAF